MTSPCRGLGDLEGSAPGAIEGLVLLPSGLSPAGLRIQLGNSWFADRDRTVTTDATGRFRFDGLGEGEHHVWVEEKQGVVVRGGPTPVTLGRGEEKSVTLDLSQRVPCAVEVVVRVNVEPVEGMQVWTRLAEGNRNWSLGLTDAEGRFSGSVEGVGEVRFEVHSAAGLYVGATEEVFALVPGGRQRVEVSVSAGLLTATLPGDAELPGPFRWILQMKRIDAEGARWRTAHLAAGLFKAGAGEKRADLGWIEPGSWRLRLHAGQRSFEGEVAVVAGQSLECALVERGR